MKKILIVIPARFGSSRFKGKPLVKIVGKSMLQRVYEIAQKAIESMQNATIIIATEDKRIQCHAEKIGAKVVLTKKNCKTGSDRALVACEQLNNKPDIILNLQGDTPLISPIFIQIIINELLKNDVADVVTPVVQLSWQALDILRKNKKITPFSGTTVIIDSNYNALWFSKNIIPAIRQEQNIRKKINLSPVLKHIGLYAYKYSSLQKFVNLSEGHYEKLEGLEQLRMLECGMKIKVVKVDDNNIIPIGVDTPDDLQRVIDILKESGEMIK